MSTRRKFTVAVILALILLGVPIAFIAESAINDTRNEARMARSRSNLQHIREALLAYLDAHHDAWPESLADLSSSDRSLKASDLICPTERGKYVYRKPAPTDLPGTAVVFESGGRNAARQGVIFLCRDGMTGIQYGAEAEKIAAQR
jgi:type II secretory pathway pseudopilin PulG